MKAIEEILCRILKSATRTEPWGPEPIILSAEEWGELFRSSFRQTVAALVLDEVERHGNNMPQNVLSQWRSYAKFAGRRFDAHIMAVNHLSAALATENIRVMILKGFGLALNYPRPELRECGDIDIYSFENYDRVNELVVQKGLCKEVDMTEEKHHAFTVDGIGVENHWKFTSDYNKATRVVGKALQGLSVREDPALPGFILPGPDMGALHLLIHTLSHLAWSGIRFRHLCDLSLYLNRFGPSMDWAFISSVLDEAGLTHSTEVLLSICRKYFGLKFDTEGLVNPEAGATGSASEKMTPASGAVTLAEEKMVIESMTNPFKDSSKVRNPFKKLQRKIHMYRHRKSLYRLVYGEEFPESFLDSFVILGHKK